MKKNLLIGFVILVNGLSAVSAGESSYFRIQEVPDSVRICALRVEMAEDTLLSTTGNGTFLVTNEGYECPDVLIDPPPHNRAYFRDHIRALSNYYRFVSHGKCIIDTAGSEIYPLEDNLTIKLPHDMAFYSSFSQPDSQDFRLAEMLRESVLIADSIYNVDFSLYDLVVIFHAGLGQDFQIFLDQTPRDIPSAFLNLNDLSAAFAEDETTYRGIQTNDDVFIKQGVILPETQNFLLYDNWESVLQNPDEPCDFQFGLNGTFAFMLGYYLGLPGLYNTENNYSGIGKFGLMDQGSSNLYGLIPAVPSAWERYALGWETPVTLPENQFITIPSVNTSPDSSSWIVPINTDEYFLIENRNNHIYPGVSFDSLRYRNWEKTSEWLNPFSVIRDSLKANFSQETGVLLSVRNYDWGIPGSGLLIWHIDDSVIRSGIDANRVNINPERFGVDLEEGDGAQDLGYPSPFFSTEMESGWLFDPWYAGNPGFFHLNPTYPRDEENTVGFTPYTHPNSNSNDGTRTLISLTDIGAAGERMTLFYSRSVHHLQWDLNLSEPFYASVVDYNQDGKEEIAIISDSLRLVSSDSTGIKSFPIFDFSDERAAGKFYPLNSGGFSCFSYKEGNDSLYLYKTSSGNISDFIRVWGGLFSEITTNVVFSENDFLAGMKNSEGKYYLVSSSKVLELDPLNLIKTSQGEDMYIFTREGQLYSVEDIPDLRVSLLADFEGNYTIPATGAYLSAAQSPDFVAVNSEGKVFSVIDENSNYILNLPEGPITLGTTRSKAGNVLTTVFRDRIERFYLSGAEVENFPFTIPSPWDQDTLSSHWLDVVFEDGSDLLIAWVPLRGIFIWDENGKPVDFSPISYDKTCHSMGIFKNMGTWLWIADSSGTIDAWKISDDEFSPYSWKSEEGNLSTPYFMPAPYQEFQAESEDFFAGGSVYNYPNPVYGNFTKIRYLLQKEAKVRISVYDLAGDMVNSYTLSSVQIGEPSEFVWDVSSVQSGVYFVNVKASDNGKSQMQILKVMVIH